MIGKPVTSHQPPVTAPEFLGGYAEGVTPVPIPNTEVKPLRVDGTARVAVWESRSPPGILLRAALVSTETRAALRSDFVDVGLQLKRSATS